MSNMSYCRFQNTVSDLRECAGALEELLETSDSVPTEEDVEGTDLDDEDYSWDESVALSHDERIAATALIQQCFDIVALVSESMGLDLFSEEHLFLEGHEEFLEQTNALVEKGPGHE